LTASTDTQVRTRGKSSYSGGNGGQCVEVAAITTHPDSPEPICAVRDSKDPEGPVLAFSPGHWRTFAGRVKAGTSGLA
jgi:hypothetical protein